MEELNLGRIYYDREEVKIPLLPKTIIYDDENGNYSVNDVIVNKATLAAVVFIDVLALPYASGATDKIRRFWLDQTLAVINEVTPTDYTGQYGALEFFKLTLIKQGITDNNYNLTPLGEIVVRVVTDQCNEKELPVTEIPDGLNLYSPDIEKDGLVEWFLFHALTEASLTTGVYRMKDGKKDLSRSPGRGMLSTPASRWAVLVLSEEYGYTEYSHFATDSMYSTDEGYDKFYQLLGEFGVDKLYCKEFFDEDWGYVSIISRRLSEFKTIMESKK